jgi:ribokinase
MTYGVIRRIRRGWYASLDAPEIAVRARHAGGRLACVSALEYHGAGPPSDAIHIDVPRSSQRPALTEGVVVHWSRRTLAGDEVAVSVAEARLQAARCRYVRGMSAAVVIVGSANVDQVFRVAAIPAPGETVLSSGFSIALGGKGQNQAVAAARAGAETAFIGALGDDAFGASIRDGLAADRIGTAGVRSVDAPTGTALIAVDDSGENTIIVEAGANALLELREADAAAIAEAAVLVLQLEIPLDTVTAAATAARAAGTRVLLNAAPIRDLPAELLANVDILVVNEHEGAFLARGAAVETLAPVVIVTLGAAGAVAYENGGEVRVPAPKVSAVDATGAGDTFCGALAAVLAEGAPLDSALRFAVAAASLSVQKHGAVPSIPARDSIESALM